MSDIWALGNDGLLAALDPAYRSVAATGPGAGDAFEIRLLVHKRADGRFHADSDILIPLAKSYLCVNENYGMGGRGGNGLEIHAADGDSLHLCHRNGAVLTRRWTMASNGDFHPSVDNSVDAGKTGQRVKTIHLVNSPSVTSDAREKAWRGGMGEAHLRAARRIELELGFYQWLTEVGEIGEASAPLYFGVRAQAVWAILVDEGLIVDNVSPFGFVQHHHWTDIETGEPRDRYALCIDQLALFLIAAQGARLAALEAAL